MDERTPDRPEPDRAEGCLDLEAMDRIVSDPAYEAGPDVRAHLESCEPCRDRLAEIRRADRFLDRFRPGAGDAAPLERPDPGSVQVPGYRILELLAHGGQGAVYRAVQRGTEREVAIKVPLGSAQRRPSARYRFEREIELTARLDHPGIVRVLGACEVSDGRLGCVMEFVRGDAFDRWASERRANGALRDIVAAGEAVADAIAFAHQRAIIHRDIKPSNVIVTGDGTPRVLDFGLAKAIDDSGSSFATMTGAFLGTLLYSAPEQISKGAGTIDLRTDVYALGLLLFQALTGRLPYDADAPPGELVHRIRDYPPTRPSSLEPRIGSELDAVVMKAMAKEPERRYQSVAELRDDLRAWLDGRAVRARADSRWYRLRKKAWQHRRFIALAGTAFIALGAVLVAGLIAREQAARAELATAVRDARTLESHWVRMAELRSIGRDNFEAGEFGAWDALLEPEPVLVRNGIEGPIGEERTPSGAAYWALWEIYLNTPVVFSLPTLDRSLAAYDTRLDAIVKASESSGALQWWDWRSGVATRSVPVRPASGVTSFLFSPDARTAILSCFDGESFFVDVQAGSCIRFDPRVVTRGTRIANDRVLTSVLAENNQIELRLWDSEIRPPSLIARIPTDYPESADVDASGSILLALSSNGDLSAFDMRTGEVILRRSGEVQPRFLKVQTRGNPGEFLLFGSGSSVYALNMHDREKRFVLMAEKGTFADGAREIATAVDSERIVAVSDRYRLEIGSSTEPTTRPALPALSATGISLSPDGAVAFAQALPSRRSIAFEIEGDAVRRIPFPAGVAESGFATVTCVRFSEDSATLFAAGMDGSVRGFDIRSGAERWRTEHDLENGIEIMSLLGDSVYVGTHDLGRGDATVLRFRDGSTEQLHAANERRFSGLEVDPDGRLWGLTGVGHLILINTEDWALIRETHLERHPDSSTFRALARLERHALLVAGPAETGVVLLDEDTLAPIGEVEMPPIFEIAVSPTDPGLFATAGDDGRIRLWRLRPGPSPEADLVREMGAHAGGIFCLAFSPDGNRIASGGGAPERRDVRIWDVEHGRELAAMDLFELGVFALAFSPDGRWLAASGEVHPDHPERGGQLFLIDLHAPDRCIAGNLEYHLARFVKTHGREPERAGALREWARRAR
jgi:WD40 repeat protein